MEVVDFVTFPKYLFMSVFFCLGICDLISFITIHCNELISLLLSLCLLNFLLVILMKYNRTDRTFYLVLFLWAVCIAVFSYYFNKDECFREQYFLEIVYVLQILWSGGFLIYHALIRCIDAFSNRSGIHYIQV